MQKKNKEYNEREQQSAENRQMRLSMLMNRRKQIVQQLPVVLVETLVVSL